MIKISKEDLAIELFNPIDDENYLSTRFDWSGIFKSLKYKGMELLAPWYDGNNPLIHDNVHGPAEEFVIEPQTDRFVKYGVGLVEKPQGEVYNRFTTYPILDKGHRCITHKEDEITFSHVLDDVYSLTKTIAIHADGSLHIRHSLHNLGTTAISCHHYSHNFFLTEGSTSCDILYRFPSTISGAWRDDYSEQYGSKTDCELHVHTLPPQGRSAFIGQVRAEAYLDGKIVDYICAKDGLQIGYFSSVEPEFSVFWGGPRIACVEPYHKIEVAPGDTFEWENWYVFTKE